MVGGVSDKDAIGQGWSAIRGVVNPSSAVVSGVSNKDTICQSWAAIGVHHPSAIAVLANG